jgi:hypothetical protein
LLIQSKSNIFSYYKHSSLTTKIRKTKKSKIGRIDSWKTDQIEEIGKNGDDGAQEVEVGVSKIRRKRVDLVGQKGVDFIFGGLRFADF